MRSDDRRTMVLLTSLLTVADENTWIVDGSIRRCSCSVSLYRIHSASRPVNNPTDVTTAAQCKCMLHFAKDMRFRERPLLLLFIFKLMHFVFGYINNT